MDISLTHYMSHPSVKDGHAVPPGDTALRRETHKFDKYLDLAIAANMRFYPLVYEIHGRAGKRAEEWFSIIMALLKQQDGGASTQAMEEYRALYWRGRIAVVRHTKIAEAVMRRHQIAVQSPAHKR